MGGALLLGPGTGWSAVALVDVNGDGRADIVWQKADGTTAAWTMDGLTQSGGFGIAPASGHAFRRAADFNGDGRMDLLMQDAAGGTRLWLVNGVNTVDAQVMPSGLGWTPIPQP